MLSHLACAIGSSHCLIPIDQETSGLWSCEAGSYSSLFRNLKLLRILSQYQGGSTLQESLWEPPVTHCSLLVPAHHGVLFSFLQGYLCSLFLVPFFSPVSSFNTCATLLSPILFLLRSCPRDYGGVQVPIWAFDHRAHQAPSPAGPMGPVPSLPRQHE